MKSCIQFLVVAALVAGAAAAEAVDRGGRSAASPAIILNHLSVGRDAAVGGGLTALFRTWLHSQGTGLETSDANLGLLLIVR